MWTFIIVACGPILNLKSSEVTRLHQRNLVSAETGKDIRLNLLSPDTGFNAILGRNLGWNLDTYEVAVSARRKGIPGSAVDPAVALSNTSFTLVSKCTAANSLHPSGLC